MIIPVKETLNNAGHIDAKLINFSEICQKKPAKSAVFNWLFLGKVSPRNLPWNWLIFLRNICPENPSQFDFFPLKSRKISRFFCKFWLFSHENPAKSADFSANLPLKIPRNMQKPCLIYLSRCLRLCKTLCRCVKNCLLVWTRQFGILVYHYAPCPTLTIVKLYKEKCGQWGVGFNSRNCLDWNLRFGVLSLT